MVRLALESSSRQQIVQSLGEDFLSDDQHRLNTRISRLRRKAGYRFYANAEVRPSISTCLHKVVVDKPVDKCAGKMLAKCWQAVRSRCTSRYISRASNT